MSLAWSESTMSKFCEATFDSLKSEVQPQPVTLSTGVGCIE